MQSHITHMNSLRCNVDFLLGLSQEAYSGLLNFQSLATDDTTKPSSKSREET